MRRLTILFVTILAILGCSRFVNPYADDRFGFIDESGKVVVEVKYPFARSYNEGLAAVSKGWKYGFIDLDGNEVIDFKYDLVLGFNEELALVLKGKRCGYIDKKGQFVVPPTYKRASSFVGGLASVALDEKVGYIDKSGNLIIDYLYENNSFISDGLINVEKDDRWGYINRDGEVVIDFIFREASPFYEGYAIVKLKNKRTAIIDKEGNVLGGREVDRVPLNLNVRSFPLFFAKRHFIYYNNYSKSFSMSQERETLPIFSNERALVELNGKYGYIDKKGELIIPAIYDKAFQFSEGAALVFMGKGKEQRCKVIDKSGNDIMEVASHISLKKFFIDGKMEVYNRLNEKSGIIYRDGRIEYLKDYKIVKPYHGELNIVSNEPRKYGLADRKGRLLLEAKYQMILPMSDGRALILRSKFIENGIKKSTKDKSSKKHKVEVIRL